MRFKIVVNMPTYKEEHLVHQILAESDHDSIESLLEVFAEDGYAIVRELYKNRDSGALYVHGELGIPFHIVGKIAYLDSRGGNDA